MIMMIMRQLKEGCDDDNWICPRLGYRDLQPPNIEQNPPPGKRLLATLFKDWQ